MIQKLKEFGWETEDNELFHKTWKLNEYSPALDYPELDYEENWDDLSVSYELDIEREWTSYKIFRKDKEEEVEDIDDDYRIVLKEALQNTLFRSD